LVKKFEEGFWIFSSDYPDFCRVNVVVRTVARVIIPGVLKQFSCEPVQGSILWIEPWTGRD